MTSGLEYDWNMPFLERDQDAADVNIWNLIEIFNFLKENMMLLMRRFEYAGRLNTKDKLNFHDDFVYMFPIFVYN